jgi:hypothetical protein
MPLDLLSTFNSSYELSLGTRESHKWLALRRPAYSSTRCQSHILLNVDSRVRGGESNGSRYESNGLELTVIYCEQV